MEYSMRLFVNQGKPPSLVVAVNGKEYSIRWDEKGIHVWCSEGVKVEMTDIGEPCRWVIIK